MPEVEISIPRFHPKQQIAFDSKATDILFGGSTRGGKSFFIRRAYIVFCSQIPGLLCDIFRLNFQDAIDNHMTGETSFPVLLNEWRKAGLCKINQTEITFWNDSKIYLRHCSDDVVMMNHQGNAAHVRTFEESTQIPEHRIRWLTGWVTMSEEMKSRVPEKWKGCFPRVYHTSNPLGISAPYYRREYVKARPKLSIEQVGVFKRQYIPALVEDNPSEDAASTRLRITAAMGDGAIADAMLNEDWDAPVGDYLREYKEDLHCVPDFTPPEHWFRYRAFDWGFSEPFCVLWGCISDGEEFKDEYGQKRWFPRDALIVYREWYGCNPTKPQDGIRMSNADVAQGIIDRSEPGCYPDVVTDSKAFQSTGGLVGSRTIAEEFATIGVRLTKAETSRIPGWSMLTSRLIGVDGYPMLYIVESCRYLREYLPSLPHDKHNPADAAKSGPSTHSSDTARYLCTSRPMTLDAEKEESTLIIQPNKLTFNHILEHHLNRQRG